MCGALAAAVTRYTDSTVICRTTTTYLGVNTATSTCPRTTSTPDSVFVQWAYTDGVFATDVYTRAKWNAQCASWASQLTLLSSEFESAWFNVSYPAMYSPTTFSANSAARNLMLQRLETNLTSFWDDMKTKKNNAKRNFYLAAPGMATQNTNFDNQANLNVATFTNRLGAIVVGTSVPTILRDWLLAHEVWVDFREEYADFQNLWTRTMDEGGDRTISNTVVQSWSIPPGALLLQVSFSAAVRGSIHINTTLSSGVAFSHSISDFEGVYTSPTFMSANSSTVRMTLTDFASTSTVWNVTLTAVFECPRLVDPLTNITYPLTVGLAGGVDAQGVCPNNTIAMVLPIRPCYENGTWGTQRVGLCTPADNTAPTQPPSTSTPTPAPNDTTTQANSSSSTTVAATPTPEDCPDIVCPNITCPLPGNNSSPLSQNRTTGLFEMEGKPIRVEPLLGGVLGALAIVIALSTVILLWTPPRKVAEATHKAPTVPHTL
jgi:hypothetical protein